MYPLLRYDSIEVCYKEKPALENISFSLGQGEILGIVGESGSGKSTIIKAAMGLLGTGGTVSSGRILFRGNDLGELSQRDMRKLRGAEMAMVFQDCGAAMCPVRTVGSQIYESLRAHRSISRTQAREYAMELFDRLNLKDGPRIWDSYPFEMSGGMNQRIGIAMAMLHKPPLLLADEPTSALDVTVQKQVLSELLSLRDNFGTSIVLVTHNIGLVSAMADQVLVLKDGKLVECGPAERILKEPQNEYTKELISAAPVLRRN